MSTLDEILKPPLRERHRVEEALTKVQMGDVGLLALLLNQGDVNGDWRRALVRRRIKELVEASLAKG